MNLSSQTNLMNLTLTLWNTDIAKLVISLTNYLFAAWMQDILSSAQGARFLMPSPGVQ
jgi:hypothetical protein